MTQSEGLVSLRVEMTGIDRDADDTASDRYEISSEFIQESIWSNPQVIAAAKAVGEAASPDVDEMTILAGWRDDIEAALIAGENGGPQDPADTGFTGSKLQLYNLFVRGAQAYETERPVLVRTRTIPISYSNQFTMEAVPSVYSTARLGILYSLPNEIIARLPTAPTTAPSGTQWAWKRRRLSSSYTANGRVEETVDWVFAAWDTLLYTYVP